MPRGVPRGVSSCLLAQMDLIVLSENGFASSTEVLNLADQLKPKKMRKREAEQVLQRLVQDKWLSEVVALPW